MTITVSEFWLGVGFGVSATISIELSVMYFILLLKEIKENKNE